MEDLGGMTTDEMRKRGEYFLKLVRDNSTEDTVIEMSQSLSVVALRADLWLIAAELIDAMREPERPVWTTTVDAKTGRSVPPRPQRIPGG